MKEEIALDPFPQQHVSEVHLPLSNYLSPLAGSSLVLIIIIIIIIINLSIIKPSKY